MVGPGPMMGPGPMAPAGSAPAVEGLPPGAHEIPLPSDEVQPAAPSPQDQSRRRTSRPPQGMGLGPDSGRLPDMIRLPGTGRQQATGHSSRRRPAATDNVQGIPASPRRPSLQNTSSRNKTPSPAASGRQKSSPGFIGPTGYDLR
jgi:hypothetical protein